MSSAVSAGCTACEEDCNAMFTCAVCGERKHKCSTMVGGFERPTQVCEICFREVNHIPNWRNYRESPVRS